MHDGPAAACPEVLIRQGPGATPAKVTNIVVYDNGVKVFGNEPARSASQLLGDFPFIVR